VSAPKKLMMKLALRLAESGDADGCAEALRGLIGMSDDERAHSELRAVTKKDFARMLSVTPEHVSALVKRGEIPSSATVGHGRGLRIIVDLAVAALQQRPAPKPEASDAESEGAAYVRARSSLRVVS
jgi:hypothetical protein